MQPSFVSDYFKNTYPFLGTVKDVSRIDHNNINSINFLIKTSKGSFVLRKFVDYSPPKKIEKICEILEYCVKQKAKVSKPIMNKNKKYVDSKRKLFVTKYYQGSSFRGTNAELKDAAKSLPVGYILYVKDHPGMSFKAGPGRTISFYNQIIDLPNVKLLHPEVSQDEILKSCSLVITINGTTGLEAAFYGKPALTLVETLYSHLPSVITIKTPEDLPHAIIQALEKKVEPSSLEEFVNFIEANSFEIDRKLLYSDFRNKFLYKEIDANEMKSYFKDHNSSFETIGLEYISKIKKIKDNKQ